MYIPLGMAQVNFLWTGNGLPHGAQTTFGVGLDSEYTPLEVANKAITAWNHSNAGGSLSVQVGITSVHVKLGPNDIGAAVDLATNSMGSSGSEPLPPNVALVVSKNTAQGGHSGKGRMFIPGWPEGSTPGGGKVEGVPKDAFQACMTSFHEELALAGIPMYLLRAKQDPSRPSLEVSSLTVQSLMATQRRRLRG